MNDAVPTMGTNPPPTSLTSTIAPSTLAPQSPWDCNFEGGILCQTWTDDIEADFRWIVKRGQTPTFNTGPSVGL